MSNYLTFQQVKQLINSINNSRDKLMLRLLYETGCDVNELVNIKVKDILGNKIHIGKRFPMISSKLAKDINLYVKGNMLTKESYLISSSRGQISVKRITQLVQFHTEKHLKKKLNPQQFRYYHIIHAYSNGVLLENIASQLGITKLRVFQIIDKLNIKQRNNYGLFLRKN